MQQHCVTRLQQRTMSIHASVSFLTEQNKRLLGLSIYSSCELIVTKQIGHALLRVSGRGNFVNSVFLKAYYLTSFLKYIRSLSDGVFGCYSMLNTLPLIKKCVIKAVKVLLEQFKLAKYPCNMQEQLISCSY